MVAIRKDSTLGTNFTQASLFAAIKAAMLDAGFSAPIDDYTSGTDRIVVYAFVTDATKIYGITYYRIKVSNTFVISHIMYPTWNATTHAGTNGSSEYTFVALSTSNTVNFTSLNGGTEYKFCFITQGSTFFPLGVIAPINRPNWWNLNNWNYAFLWSSSSVNSLSGTALNPYASASYALLLNSSLMLSPNSQTGDTDVLTGLILLNFSGRGVAGKSSDDLGVGCVSAASRYNTIPTGNINQNFLIISPVAGGLVIKI